MAARRLQAVHKQLSTRYRSVTEVVASRNKPNYVKLSCEKCMIHEGDKVGEDGKPWVKSWNVFELAMQHTRFDVAGATTSILKQVQIEIFQHDILHG